MSLSHDDFWVRGRTLSELGYPALGGSLQAIAELLPVLHTRVWQAADLAESDVAGTSFIPTHGNGNDVEPRSSKALAWLDQLRDLLESLTGERALHERKRASECVVCRVLEDA